MRWRRVRRLGTRTSLRGSGTSRTSCRLYFVGSSVFRHCSNGTNSAAGTPHLVTSRGPCVRPASRNSLKWAIAAGTCQVLVMRSACGASQSGYKTGQWSPHPENEERLHGWRPTLCLHRSFPTGAAACEVRETRAAHGFAGGGQATWGKPRLLLGSTAHVGGTGRLASGRRYPDAQFPLSEPPGRFTLR